MTVIFDDNSTFDSEVAVIIVGAGACGIVAALTAREAGADVLVIERDEVPQGSTALSSGMIPACNTHFQRERGIEDSVAQLAADIQRKSQGNADSGIVNAVCRESGPAIEWLTDHHKVPLQLVDGFMYPGHSVLRMHAPPSKTGAELIGALTNAASAADIDIFTSARVTCLIAGSDRKIRGIEVERPDGSVDRVGCKALVLACNGYGGNPDMVRKYIPEIAIAAFAGHIGNQGDAIMWGRALGAGISDMGAYQGHGSWASPHGMLITWAVMTEGGIQVNTDALRFSNEHQGYSEAAVDVLAQPGSVAWNIYDKRIHDLGMTFQDYRDAEKTGAIRHGVDVVDLAVACGLDTAGIARTLSDCAGYAAGREKCAFGRDFTTKPALEAPYYGICVTGALFHTQGGLAIDPDARVLREDGSALPNLFAGGGAARGVSGNAVWGYLSGNGLLTAVTLGRIAGRGAAMSVQHEHGY
ncbi:MAG: FAD-dependent oxidoreductase [Pseudomonadota bacterium]|nr:FAD-dependent oxidoreductase [Pseudomonadota bacterium]